MDSVLLTCDLLINGTPPPNFAFLLRAGRAVAIVKKAKNNIPSGIRPLSVPSQTRRAVCKAMLTHLGQHRLREMGGRLQMAVATEEGVGAPSLLATAFLERWLHDKKRAQKHKHVGLLNTDLKIAFQSP